MSKKHPIVNRKRGVGRPSLGDQARTHAIVIKVSSAELAQLTKRVERDDVKLSTWARAQMLAALDA